MDSAQLTNSTKALLNVHILIMNKAAIDGDWDTYWREEEFLSTARMILSFQDINFRYNYNGKEIDLL